MTIINPVTPLTPYTAPYEPVSNITPFTYRDGLTYLEVLTGLRRYITDIVVPYADSTFNELGTEFAAQVNTMIDTVNASLVAEDSNVATAITNLTNYVNSQVAAIVGGSVTINDPIIQAIINNVASTTRVLLDGLYVNESELPAKLGAVDGIIYPNLADGTITYAALQTALTAAAAAGKKVVAYGTITTDQTITIKGDADLGGLTVNYTGNGIGVQVGANTGVVTFDKTVTTPRITHTAKTILGWSQVAGTIGVRLINLNGCKVYIPFIRNFEISLDNRGEAQGCVYNTVTLGAINNGKIGIQFLSDATGWANQNTFIGGTVGMDSAEGNKVVGTRAVDMLSSANLPNTNTFIGVSLEGNGWEYQFETWGLYNVFFNCRYESSLGAKVWFRASAVRNAILQGYGTVTAQYEAGQSLNSIDMSSNRRMMGNGTAGVLVIENSTSSANNTVVVVDAGATAAGTDPATAYDWGLSAQVLHGKRSTDAFDRVALSATGGSLLFGNGTAAPVAGIQGNGTVLQIASGVTIINPLVDNAVSLGQAGFRFQNAFFGSYIRLGTTTTAGRPTAASAGAGANLYDTDLGKPIWSNGAVWKDAAGTTV